MICRHCVVFQPLEAFMSRLEFDAARRWVKCPHHEIGGISNDRRKHRHAHRANGE